MFFLITAFNGRDIGEKLKLINYFVIKKHMDTRRINILNMDTRQTEILNRLYDAETDRHNFIYFSVNNGLCIFKLNKHHLDNITQYDENIHHEGVMMYLYQIPNVYRYQTEWVENPFVWLHSICDIYTIEEAQSYEWGNNIEYKRDYSLYRFILFKLFMSFYINDLRHRMWQPGTKHVKKLEAQFNSYVIKKY